MSLQDRIGDDLNRVFLNTGQFAQTHRWENTDLLCVLDNEVALKRKNNNVVDISWDNSTVEVLIYAREDAFPKRPLPQQTVYFDRYQWTVLQVTDNLGLLEVLLNRKASKGVNV